MIRRAAMILMMGLGVAFLAVDVTVWLAIILLGEQHFELWRLFAGVAAMIFCLIFERDLCGRLVEQWDAVLADSIARDRRP